MAERPRFFDDLAGVAGGAFSALAGMREEVEATIRARVDEAIRRLDLVKREDLEAVQEMAALARAGQEAAERRLSALEARLAEMTSPVTPPAAATSPVTAATSAEAAPPASTPAATDSGTPFEPPSID
jgi:BMFP domain-containing protein YqiC